MASVQGLGRLDAGKVLGLADIQAKLKELSRGTAQNVIRRGLNAGGAVIRDEARRLVPVRTGALKKSIISRTNRKGQTRDRVAVEVVIDNKVFTEVERKSKKKGRVTKKLKGERRKAGVGIAGKIYPRNYAHLVEYGTKPHALGKGSKLNPTKGEAEQSGRMHPGAKPKPFMRPAYLQKQDEALDAIKTKTRAELNKELAKLAQKRKAAG